MDPFPGNIGQIFQAKNLDEKPKFPTQFPAALENVIKCGWSQKPRERPEIEKFESALNLILKHREGKTLKVITKSQLLVLTKPSMLR